MNASSDRMSWSNPRVLSVLLLLYLCGGLSGAIAYRIARSRVVSRSVAGGAVPSWSNKEGFLNRCKKDLNLSDEQLKRISAELDDYRMYYQNLQEQLDEVRSTGKGRIMAILDPEQRKKFEKLLGDAK